MKKIYLFLTIAVIPLMAIFGCSKKSSNSLSPNSSTGTLKMLLTDAPGDFDEVNITFSEIAVHKGLDDNDDKSDSKDSGWIIINTQEQVFDLLSLSNGVTSILGEYNLEYGHYSQIKLTIVSAEVVIGLKKYDITIPSGNLKFVSGFEINENTTTELIVDFDVARSIHKTGGKSNKYMLRPTIRIIENIMCGSISGLITNFNDNPIAYAIAGTDTISSTIINKENGSFTLGFIKPGIYTVSISDTLNKNYTEPSVIVTNGIKTDLGFLTLQ